MATPARIGYQNYVVSATASSEAVGFEADSVTNSLTFERWKPEPEASPSIVVDLGSVRAGLNYIGIGAHTLRTRPVTISYSTTGASYTTVYSSTLASNRALMVTPTAFDARYIKIQTTGQPTIGVIYVGTYLEMYRPFYSGFTPGVLSRNTTVKPNKSVNGQWLGRSIIRQGLATDFKWQHTPLSWYISNVEPLSVHAQTEPFFIQWSPAQYPTDVLYCWTIDDIKPTNAGGLDYVEFGFSVEAIE